MDWQRGWLTRSMGRRHRVVPELPLAVYRLTMRKSVVEGVLIGNPSYG